MTEITSGDTHYSPYSNPESDKLLDDVFALESQTWAPWLAYTRDQMAKHRQIFPEGQFQINDTHCGLQGILSTNRFNWSGDNNDLPTWDNLAGQDITYEDTFESDGNTLALMSISIDHSASGQALYRQLIQAAQNYARKNDVQRLIGDFRPSGFGTYKRNTGDFNFANYCQLNRMDAYNNSPFAANLKVKRDDQLIDPWLRAVKRLGMVELCPDAKAMVVRAPLDSLANYMQSYKPENWWKVTDPEQISYLLSWHQPHQHLESVEEIWECGETGTWYVDATNGQSVYIESNLWGELPVRTWRYDLSSEELQQAEQKLVRRIESETGHRESVRNVWIKSDNILSNIIRSWEAKYFPEIAAVVDDDVESHSAFLATVDTRNHSRVVHAARITGPLFAKEQKPASSETFFAGIDELIKDGYFTAEDFRTYYQQLGVDIQKCIGVETNMRVGEKSPKFNGVSHLNAAYLAFFRMVEACQPEINQGGVFANVNWVSLRSFKLVGLDYAHLLGRKDIRYKSGSQDYIPVFLPYSTKNIQLFGRLAKKVPQEIFI